MRQKAEFLPLWMGGLILLLLLFPFPLAFQKVVSAEVPLFGEVSGTDFAVLSLLGAGAALFLFPSILRNAESDRLCRLLLQLAGAGSAVILLQQIVFGWNTFHFLDALSRIVFPLAGLALAREIRRFLPCFLLVLFCVSAAISLRELLAGLPPHGLAGNWNWNWTLLVISSPSLAFGLPRRFRLAAGLLLAFGFSAGQFLIAPRFASRGTFFSACFAFLLIGGALFFRRKQQWRGKAAIAGMVLAALLGSAGLFSLRSGFFHHIPLREIRPALWQGALLLGTTHPLLGIEPSRFEGEIPSCLPLAYFDSDFAADRHPHPHNELLFYWCGFGLFGLAWCALMFASGLRGLFRLRLRDERTLLASWCWAVLLLHGQLDVILATPTAGALFLLLTGVLLAGGIRRLRAAPSLWSRALLLALLWGGAILLFAGNVAGGWFCRAGKLALQNGDFATARRALARSVAIRPAAGNLYALASVEFFVFHEPLRAVETFQRIREECLLPSYSHSSGRMARALASSGQWEASLPYFEEEQNHFPRSIVNLLFWQSVLEHLGFDEKAARIGDCKRELMRRKGIRPEEIPHLLRNQTLDDSPLALRNFLEKLRK